LRKPGTELVIEVELFPGAAHVFDVELIAGQARGAINYDAALIDADLLAVAGSF
jgi:hypothetical protein